MTTMKDKLQRLQVASPCSSSWEAMHGDGRRRRCLECDKLVYDFAQLTSREIAGVIEASQGELCARLTRDEWGQLVTLQPPVTADPLASRRASPLVTAVVTAVLGLSERSSPRPCPPLPLVFREKGFSLHCPKHEMDLLLPTFLNGVTKSGGNTTPMQPVP